MGSHGFEVLWFDERAVRSIDNWFEVEVSRLGPKSNDRCYPCRGLGDMQEGRSRSTWPGSEKGDRMDDLKGRGLRSK